MPTSVRWGLIGCGDISRKRVAPALRDAPGGTLHAVARRQAELAAEFAAEFGALKHYSDWRELLTDPDIDAVYVATPPHLHAEQSIAAAQAGKHVLCEKPIALGSVDGERIAAACRDARVKLGVAYYRRFYPVVDRLKQIMTDGTIGKPVLVRFDCFEQVNPAPGEARDWLMDPQKSGGGPLADFGCHRLEVLVNWFGEPTDVLAFADAVTLDREVEDTSTVLMRFAAGVRGEVTATHAVRGFRDTAEILGSEGVVKVPSLNGGDITIETAEGTRHESHPPHANLHQPLVEDFVAAIAEGREPGVGAEAALAVQRILDAVYEVV